MSDNILSFIERKPSNNFRPVLRFLLTAACVFIDLFIVVLFFLLSLP